MEFAHEIIVVVEGAASVYTNVEVGEAGTVEALFNVAIGFVEVEGEAAMSMVEGAVLVGGIGKNESRGESSESKGRAETTGEGGHGVRTDWEWETRGCWIRWRDICEGGGEVKGKNVVDVLGREGGLFGTRTPRPSPGSGGRLQQPRTPTPRHDPERPRPIQRADRQNLTFRIREPFPRRPSDNVTALQTPCLWRLTSLTTTDVPSAFLPLALVILSGRS